MMRWRLSGGLFTWQLVGDSLDHIYIGILKLITWLVISCSENSYNILMAAVCKPHLGIYCTFTFHELYWSRVTHKVLAGPDSDD